MNPTDYAANKEILEAFHKSLHGIGYPERQIQQGYGYSNFIDDGRRETVDLAAFGSAVPSLRTCNIGVLIDNHVTAESLIRLRSLGAPLLFTYDARNSQLSRWRMTKNGLPTRIHLPAKIAPERLPSFFLDNRVDWDPEAFRQARAAVYQEDSPQLDFFDLGLLPALEEQLQRKLSDQLQKISVNSRQKLDARDGKGAFETHFSDYAQLLFRLLAARLLCDRGDLPFSVQDTNFDEMLRAVEQKYHSNKGSKLALDEVCGEDIWHSIQSGLDLRNISPETLAFVYENTLVDPELRKRNGIHATPPYVADFLLRQLPIERLSEPDRIVFEPFCGNAPFLLAAMRRLRELLPPDRAPADVHQYLVERLLGIELLPFACEIARYSLILGDYPNDNSWQIEEGDAFNDSRFGMLLERANIVLSNPPHENFAMDRRPEGAGYNQAAEALRRVLEKPPLMLGFVMPLSFTHAKAFQSLRHQLVSTYPALRITALPDNTFGKAGQQTALIAAHLLDTQKKYFWASVSAFDAQTTFPLTGRPTAVEEVATLPGKGKDVILWRAPQRKVGNLLWDALEEFSTLDSVADLHMGLQWRTVDGERFATNIRIVSTGRDDYEPGLHKVDHTVEAHAFIGEPCFLDTRPEHLRQSFDLPWNKQKVFVNAVRVSRDKWRLVAFPDAEGLFATQNFIGIWPKSNSDGSSVINTEVLSSILNGPVANSYMHHLVHLDKHNGLPALKKLPIPSLTNAQAVEIIALTDEYLDLRWEYLDTPTPWKGSLAERGRWAVLKIDAAVLESYSLPFELEAELLHQFSGIVRGHLPFSFTGYDLAEWDAVKAELADERRGRQLSDRFDLLLRKLNLVGLTTEEEQEYESIAEERMLRRMQYRAAVESGK